MTTPANMASLGQTALPVEPAPTTDPGLVPSSGSDSAEAGGFGLLLASLFSVESGRSAELEGTALQPALEGQDGVAEGSPGAFSEAATAVTEIASGREGVSARSDAAAQLGRAPEPTAALMETGSSEPDGEVAGDGNRSFAPTISGQRGGVQAPRSPEIQGELRTPEADAARGADEPHRIQPTAPQGDRGESSGQDLGRHASASAQPTEGEAPIEPAASRVEGAARSENAPTQGPVRALPELPASNEGEIVRGARVLAREGGGAARIQLFPPELGGLEIRVVVTDRAVQLRFVADRAAVAELLNHHLPELRQALQLPGLSVERVEIAHREPGLSRDDRDAGHDGSFEGPDDRGEAREESTRDGAESQLAEPWANPWELPARTLMEGEGLARLGTVDLRA